MSDLEIRTMATRTFGDEQKAEAWLRGPLAELNGVSPLDVAATEQGAALIKTILGKIEWGAAA